MAPSAGEDVDYMSMVIPETNPQQKETDIQCRVRKQRESEARSRPKSKAELAAAASAARTDGLQTALPNTSKGFQMMAKLGFKPGSALGASPSPGARTEPLVIDVKEDRGGVGMDSEKKRKFREEAAVTAEKSKKVKANEGDFRERIGREREEKRSEALFRGAMKVLEVYEQPDASDRVPLKKVNVLYRSLLRESEVNERERRARYDLHQSMTKDPKYDDPEEDEHVRHALGKVEEDLEEEEEDEELDAFLKHEAKERLEKIINYLRQQYYYCFWCKHKYDSEDLDGCPGPMEDDHD